MPVAVAVADTPYTTLAVAATWEPDPFPPSDHAAIHYKTRGRIRA